MSSEWPRGSLIWGVPAGSGDTVALHSPGDGSLIQRARLLSPEELTALVAALPPPPAAAPDEFWPFVTRLRHALSALSTPLLDAMQRETADGLRGHPSGTGGGQFDTPDCRLRLMPCPWGTVAVILPQNAFLTVAVTALLNALRTDNRVILQAALRSARSAALLAAAVQRARPPQDAVSGVVVRSREFVQALCASPAPCLIHYMGSSRHATQILAQAFAAGKGALVDGEGNGWVYVDEDAPVEEAALLTRGALRYNGQTCTSVNGAVIHPALYPRLRAALVARWGALRAGDPLGSDPDVGPLFDEGQAAHCVRQVEESGGGFCAACGVRRTGGLLAPALVEAPVWGSGLVAEGLFGSALWIREGCRDDFVTAWGVNRFPLCAGVLSPAADAAWWLARLGSLARLTVSGDPSVEDVFEPRGGYPGSGSNPVGPWHEKYRRLVQVDGPLPTPRGTWR